MEIEVQSQQVLENVAGHSPYGFLGYIRKYCIPKFLSNCGCDPRSSICVQREQTLDLHEGSAYTQQSLHLPLSKLCLQW